MFAIIDIETTGGIYKKDKITEIAILLFNGIKVTDSFVSLVNPETIIPHYITQITGISNEMAQPAPKFYEIAKKVVELTANRTFVAHNVSFDYKFIREEFKRLGYNYQRKTACTVKLAKKYLPGHHSYSLGNICSDLDIQINGRHRAGGDAMATVRLFEIILEKIRTSSEPVTKGHYKLF